MPSYLGLARKYRPGRLFTVGQACDPDPDHPWSSLIKPCHTIEGPQGVMVTVEAHGQTRTRFLAVPELCDNFNAPIVFETEVVLFKEIIDARS
jgi:hypothetical protein